MQQEQNPSQNYQKPEFNHHTYHCLDSSKLRLVQIVCGCSSDAQQPGSPADTSSPPLLSSLCFHSAFPDGSTRPASPDLVYEQIQKVHGPSRHHPFSNLPAPGPTSGSSL